ncbi:MAG: hypothetical protein Q8M15_16825 [Bacteroidota bacterium]|nr:hypothetical protein [Bacteroidota bacterium]
MSTETTLVYDSLIFTIKEQITHNREFISGVSDLSVNLNDTTLKLLAGSILVILGSGYVKPIDGKAKLMYLLFIPAWIFLGLSFYYGNLINEKMVATGLFRNLEMIKAVINDDETGIRSLYGQQSNFLLIGVGILTIWLLIYLSWWIYTKSEIKSN